MTTPTPEKDQFSIVKQGKSFTHAGRGICIFVKKTHNAWIHLVILACAIALGIYFTITPMEWMALVLAAGFVLVSEAFNTAIEIDSTFASPTYHPNARDTKDIAAGAVLISALTATIIGLIIFLPHIMSALK